MISLLLLTTIALSIVITVLAMPFWIRKAHQIGLVWTDMNKTHSSSVAGSGGVIVTGAFVVVGLFLVAQRVFYLETTLYLVETLSLILTITLLGCIGFIDDLFGWHRGGLSRRSRMLLAVVAALPLVVVNAGKAMIEIPFLGQVDLGLLYPVFLIPLAIVGTSTTFNFLAGFNGLEAGLGVLIIGSLSLVAYLTGSMWLALLGVALVASLLCFLLFNYSPARVFPGDCLTYPVGGMIGAMAILGNFERIALFFFIPVILEVFLKARGKFVKQSFGKPRPDGSLDLRYEKLYSLNHVAIWSLRKMGIAPTERKVVLSVWLFQLVIIVLGFIIFWNGIINA